MMSNLFIHLSTHALVGIVMLTSGCATPSGPAPVVARQSVSMHSPSSARATSHERAPNTLKPLARHYANWVGAPYAFGGSNTNGIDCSGFVQLTYATVFNMTLPRTTAALRRHGQDVSGNALNVGDLVFFNVNGRNGHVGIYMGDATFMHASTSRGVVTDRLDSRYWRARFAGAVRILDDA